MSLYIHSFVLPTCLFLVSAEGEKIKFILNKTLCDYGFQHIFLFFSVASEKSYGVQKSGSRLGDIADRKNKRKDMCFWKDSANTKEAKQGWKYENLGLFATMLCWRYRGRSYVDTNQQKDAEVYIFARQGDFFRRKGACLWERRNGRMEHRQSGCQASL